LIIAYSHCIAHGINMTTAMQNQKAAVNAGHWLLYRYDPRRAEKNENPLQLDSRKPSGPIGQYLLMENRFKMLTKSKPEQAKLLFKMAQEDANTRFKFYEYLATRKFGANGEATPVAASAPAKPTEAGNETVATTA
jgi:pyruvate-ferredoxin/flavodoxin oxidoreductase